MKTKTPDQEVLQFIKKEFEYIHATGELFRRSFSYTGGKGCSNTYPRTLLNDNIPTENGYIRIVMTIDGKLKLYRLHQIVWFLCNGSWPTEEIDHINGKKLDNNISNLRLASHSQNQSNSKKQSTFKGKPPSSKYKGVSWIEVAKKWRAQIMKDGHSYYLGNFATEIEAAEAYNEAAPKYHGEFAKTNEGL